jgi:hypothetical protein
MNMKLFLIAASLTALALPGAAIALCLKPNLFGLNID